jgi:hypothetical protein
MYLNQATVCLSVSLTGSFGQTNLLIQWVVLPSGRAFFYSAQCNIQYMSNPKGKCNGQKKKSVRHSMDDRMSCVLDVVPWAQMTRGRGNGDLQCGGFDRPLTCTCTNTSPADGILRRTRYHRERKRKKKKKRRGTKKAKSGQGDLPPCGGVHSTSWGTCISVNMGTSIHSHLLEHIFLAKAATLDAPFPLSSLVVACPLPRPKFRLRPSGLSIQHSGWQQATGEVGQSRKEWNRPDLLRAPYSVVP